MTPLAQIDTPRLRLRAPELSMASATADFYRRNREAHARWNPPLPESTFSVEGQRERLAALAAAMVAGGSVAWWLFARDDAERAIGQIHLSQIARRAFHNAMLGYSIDAALEGRGLMREALQTTLADAFGPRVHLHRVQANVRPENARSLALLERLGFEHEGLAREYLFIDGTWRDHAMTALRNPAWRADAAPAI